MGNIDTMNGIYRYYYEWEIKTLSMGNKDTMNGKYRSYELDIEIQWMGNINIMNRTYIHEYIHTYIHTYIHK